MVGCAGRRIGAFQVLDAFAGLDWYHCETTPCPPGDVVSLGAHFTVPLASVAGQVTVHGQTYNFEAIDGGASAEFVFDPASIVLPELTDIVVRFTVPFTLSGSLRVPSRHEPDTFEVFELHGSGVATVTLVQEIQRTAWVVSNVTYDFEPRSNVIQR